jgi:catechol 2,3-dioxygenase-like lactoylglutathione lyase family enzyme
MMKTMLNHVRANVRNLQASVAWYTGILGLEVDFTYPPGMTEPTYIQFKRSEGAIFSIMAAEPIGARFNFYVEDVDVLWQSLRTTTKVVESLFDTPYGTRKFTISDLDGNEIGFVAKKRPTDLES